MNRPSLLLLACSLCLNWCQSTGCADAEPDKLNLGDRALVQKLLAIDPKLTWHRDPERVTFIGFSPDGATTAAMDLLPQLPGLAELCLHQQFFTRARGWQPGEMAPLSHCLALRKLKIVIAEDHTAETWKSLPALPQISELHICDQTAGRMTVSDRCPRADRIIIRTDGLIQFDASQFGNHSKLKILDLQLGKSPWSGEGLSRLSNCPSLEALQIDCEGLTNVALRELGTIKTLKRLTLLAGTFTPEGFEALTDLESLRCRGKWFNDELAVGLKNCLQLRQLDVANTEVHGACFKVLASLPLEDLRVSQVMPVALYQLRDCKTLKRFHCETKNRLETLEQDSTWQTIGQRARLSRTFTGAKGNDMYSK